MAINLNELQELLNAAQTNQASEKEIRKGLTRIENLIANVQREVVAVYELLDGATPAKKERKPRASAEPTEVDPEAPYGRKKDGTPKSKPGRSKEAEAVEA